mmetsp:Transcript_110880/g.213709  ORF Transcript_110880/g.213709 Transcript_110880/m.213709 type:complete len:638 (-) Transcript_110880:45-1958(-)
MPDRDGEEHMTLEEIRKVLKGASEIKQTGNDAFGRGEYFRALDLYDQARERLEALGETEDERREGLRPSIHYSKARALYKLEDFKRSVEEARACLKFDPAHQKARAIMEELAPYTRDDQSNTKPESPAKVVVDELPESEEPSAERVVSVVLQLKDSGNAALKQGDPDEAIRLYTKALDRLAEVEQKEGSLKAALFANRSQAHISLKSWEAASEDIDRCLAIEPENKKALFRQTLCEEGLAKAKFQREHGEALKNALWYKSTGNKRLGEGDLKAAAEEYTNGLEWLEDLPRQDESVREVRVALLANRSQACLKQKRWKEALADADSVLVEDNRHPKAKFRRAKALVELRRYYEAEVELRQIVAAEPNNQDVRTLLQQTEELAAGGAARPANEADEGERKKDGPEEEKHTWESECKRLLRESEAAYSSRSYAEASSKASAAVVILEGAVKQATKTQDWEELPRGIARRRKVEMPTGASETTQLISAYASKIRALLATHDFEAAGETAARAVKLFHWEDERLRSEFDTADGMQSSASLVESLELVGQTTVTLESALAELNKGRFVEALGLAYKALERLESKREWPPALPLRAELYSVRATAALRMGDHLACEADAELAISLDSGCARARACVREVRSICD